MKKFMVSTVINYFKRQRIQFYILIAVLLVGTILRFYNYPFRYSLGEETIRDAVIGIEGARQLQFPLTGSFSSLGPFTFGPWYAYQLIIFYFIFPFVYSPWIYLSIISVVYIFIMYKIGKILGGNTFALILSFLVAISPAQIISATHLTSHNNTNLFAALSIWIFLIILLKNKSTWWNLLLGFVIGVGMNLHFQMGGLLILPFILLVSKRKFINFFFSIFGVIFSFIPMLIFEMNNHWFTTRNILELEPDSLTKTMYEKVNQLERKYPDKKFSPYTCSKKYESSYNASTFSTLFLLELKQIFDKKGLPVGVERDCKLPKGVSFENNISGLIDFSSVSESAILEAGWTPISFKIIYDSYARWWFRVQP